MTYTKDYLLHAICPIYVALQFLTLRAFIISTCWPMLALKDLWYHLKKQGPCTCDEQATCQACHTVCQHSPSYILVLLTLNNLWPPPQVAHLLIVTSPTWYMYKHSQTSDSWDFTRFKIFPLWPLLTFDPKTNNRTLHSLWAGCILNITFANISSWHSIKFFHVFTCYC